MISIYGYRFINKETQWDKYQKTIRAFAAPYHQLPGNHDIFSRKARRIYEEHFGPLYYSFDHGGFHFVLLNNCDGGRWGFLGADQLAWLKADLRASAPHPVFVFLHFPSLGAGAGEAGILSVLAADPASAVPRFARTAVFGGHYHSYGPTREFDGIRYFITGGGGAELRPDYRKAGGQHHFMEVLAQGSRLEVRVVTEKEELADAEADVMGGFEFADKHSSRIGLDRGVADLKAGVKGSLFLQNPYAQALRGKAEWVLDPSAFAAEPGKLAVSLPPRGSTNLPFTLKVLTDRVPLSSLPWLEFDLAAGAQRHRFHRAIVFLNRLATPYRPG